MLTPFEFSQAYEAPLPTVEKAFKNLENGEVALFAVSGKMGSGKDYLGDRMSGLFRPQPVKLAFGDALKEEILELFVNPLREGRLLPVNNQEMVDYLSPHLGSENLLYGEKPEGVRSALQHWGTEVRRAQDEDYWVKKAALKAVELMASGCSVYFTDVRFTNELRMLTDLGAFTVRLEIDETTQRERLLRRDGKLPEDSRFTHSSEVELDHCEDFDLRLLSTQRVDRILLQFSQFFEEKRNALSSEF